MIAIAGRQYHNFQGNITFSAFSGQYNHPTSSANSLLGAQLLNTKKLQQTRLAFYCFIFSALYKQNWCFLVYIFCFGFCIYFAICAFQLTVCLVQIMSILKGNCKSFSFLHPCICNSACYISLGCLLVWKWCQYWEEMVRSLQWSTDMGMLESSYPHVASVFRCASTWRPCPCDLND